MKSTVESGEFPADYASLSCYLATEEIALTPAFNSYGQPYPLLQEFIVNMADTKSAMKAIDFN